MAGSIEGILDTIIRREAEFDGHPADRGGPTKYTITLATLAAWRGRAVTREDVRDLTVEEARAIYAERYERRPGYDRLAELRLRGHVIDAAVLHGPAR